MFLRITRNDVKATGTVKRDSPKALILRNNDIIYSSSVATEPDGKYRRIQFKVYKSGGNFKKTPSPDGAWINFYQGGIRGPHRNVEEYTPNVSEKIKFLQMQA